MRKKARASIVEALEQRRLLSSAFAPADLNYDGGNDHRPEFSYQPPSSGDDNPGADLGVSGATFPASVPAGPDSSFDLDPSITGINDQYARDVEVRVVLSKSGVWDQQERHGDNIFLGDSGNDVLPGEVSLSNISPGTYHVLLGVQYYWALLLKDDQSNNRVDAGMLTITPNDSADMGVTAATFPSSVPAGSSFDLEPTVVQTGPMTDVDYTILSELSPDTNWLNPSRVFLSTPDDFQSGQAIVPQTTPPGNYHLLLKISPVSANNNAPTDTDPGDDILDAGIITITPDKTDNMAVVSATVSHTVSAAGTITVTPTIFRSGALAHTDYSISVALSNDLTWGNDDDVILTPASSNPGVPFTGGEMTVPSATPAGGYYAMVHISPWSSDPNNPPPTDQIPADDTLQSGYVIVPQADMSVTAATYPTTAPAGTDIDVEPTVVRTGQLSGADYLISVALSKDGVWGSGNLNLSPDSATPDFHGGYVKVPSMLIGETYHLLVEVTPYQASQGDPLPADANLANNILDAGDITITPNWTQPWNPPINWPSNHTGDDSVTAATFPSTAEAGKKIDIEPTVSQTGGLANVDYNITVQLSTTGTWGDSGNIELDPNNNDASLEIEGSFHSGDVVVPADVPGGNYQLLVQVQPYQQFGLIQGPPVDTNSTDDVLNAGTIAITPNNSDLGLTGASFPSSAEAGATIDVEPAIVQAGDWAGDNDFTVQVILSPDGDWNNSANIALSPPVSPFTVDLYRFAGGKVVVPPTVVPGDYHVLLNIEDFNPIYNDPSMWMILPPNFPPDMNAGDNQIDAGTITISGASPPVTVPIWPIPTGTPTSTVEASAGSQFRFPASQGTKYSSVYLSNDGQLQLSPHVPKKLLKLGAVATLGTPDFKLKLQHHDQASLPINATPGLYDLLGISKHNKRIEDVGTIQIDAPAPDLFATIRPKGKKFTAGAAEKMTLKIQNTGLADANNVPITLYFSSDDIRSNDDTALSPDALAAVNVRARHRFSKTLVLDMPATLSAGKYYILIDANIDGSLTRIGSSSKLIDLAPA